MRKNHASQNIPAENILPGAKPVIELLTQHPERITKIFCGNNWQRREKHNIFNLCHKQGIPIQFAAGSFLDELSGINPANQTAVSHQGIIAILSKAKFAAAEELIRATDSSPLPVLIVLDQVQDPGNLGAIARTAYALGCSGIIVPKHNSASLGPVAHKSSAGALEKLPVALVTNLARTLEKAEENGLAIYGTACAASSPDSQEQIINAFEHCWRLPAALVLGNEEKGIRPGVAKRCARFFHIPFARNFDSLNIAQAGAILLGLCAARNKAK